jgi:hypothetical protein
MKLEQQARREAAAAQRAAERTERERQRAAREAAVLGAEPSGRGVGSIG